jgi:hypothetical protein
MSLKSAVITMLLARNSKVAGHGEKVFAMVMGVVNKKLPAGLQFKPSLADLQVLLPMLKTLLPAKPLITIDDVERAEDFKLHELLGFVSFLVSELNARVLLVLNKEKLKGERRPTWDQLREKLINIEIELRTDPADCVKFGLGELPLSHFELFDKKIRQLRITNIRVIQHMRRTYDVLHPVMSASERACLQLIPSIVLFVVLHFKALEHAPSVDETLNKLGMLDADDKTLSEAQQKVINLLIQYRLGTPDRFERELLVPFLRTGYLDKSGFQSYILELDRREKRNAASIAYEDFYERYLWDASLDDGGLLSLLNKLSEHIPYLEDGQVSQLSTLARDFASKEVSNRLIEDWLRSNAEAIRTMHYNEYPSHQDRVLAKLHPAIIAAYSARHAELYPPLTMTEAFTHFSTHDSYGDRHSSPINRATREELETFLRTTDPVTRGNVFRFFAPYLASHRSNGTFEEASAQFLQICRDIVTLEPESRLAKIVMRTAKSFGFAKKLRSTSEGVEQEQSGEPT